MALSNRLPFEPELSESGSPAHRRYYQVAGVTIRVQSDIRITDETFEPKFRQFETAEEGIDTIAIHHFFGLPDLRGHDLGTELYFKPPWRISRKDSFWIYQAITADPSHKVHQVSVFSDRFTEGRIYNGPSFERAFRRGGAASLTLFPTDQVLLARILSDRQACLLHSGAALLNDQVLFFVGHSGAGKSTVMNMLLDRAEILCDDRNVARRWDDGFRGYGTWSHGEVSRVSARSARLGGILFLQQSEHNRLTPVHDSQRVLSNLLACLIKPMVTADWWQKQIAVIELLAQEVPAYDMEFDTSGEIVDQVLQLTRRE